MSKLHVKTDFEIRGGICRYPSLLFKGMPCRQRQTERKIYSAKLFVAVCQLSPKKWKEVDKDERGKSVRYSRQTNSQSKAPEA